MNQFERSSTISGIIEFQKASKKQKTEVQYSIKIKEPFLRTEKQIVFQQISQKYKEFVPSTKNQNKLSFFSEEKLLKLPERNNSAKQKGLFGFCLVSPSAKEKLKKKIKIALQKEKIQNYKIEDILNYEVCESRSISFLKKFNEEVQEQIEFIFANRDAELLGFAREIQLKNSEALDSLETGMEFESVDLKEYRKGLENLKRLDETRLSLFKKIEFKEGVFFVQSRLYGIKKEMEWIVSLRS